MEFIIEHGTLMQELFKRGITLELPSGKKYEIPKQLSFDLEDLECKSIMESPLFLANKGDSIAWLDFWQLAYPIDNLIMNPFKYDGEELEDAWVWWLNEDKVKIIDKIINRDSITFKVDFIKQLSIAFQIHSEKLPLKTLKKLEELNIQLPEYFQWSVKYWDLQRIPIPRIGESVAFDMLKNMSGTGGLFYSDKISACQDILSIIEENTDFAKVKNVFYYEGEVDLEILCYLDLR